MPPRQEASKTPVTAKKAPARSAAKKAPKSAASKKKAPAKPAAAKEEVKQTTNMSVAEILVSLGSNNRRVRSQAEQILKNEKQKNFATFSLALLSELQDESKPKVVHQFCHVLKHSMALDVKNIEMKESLDHLWKSLSADLRSQVKQSALTTLGSPTKAVRMTAALIIANLARIELPFNEWNDLIQILVSGCESGQALYMESALTTLGFICEEAFSHDAVAEVLEKQSELIIRTICAGMGRQENDVIFAATRALANSLEFVGDHMENLEIQKYIITTVCDTIGNQAAEIRENAMRCLVKIADLYYSLLPSFIDKLFSVTSTVINNVDEEEPVILQALMFWITLSENEKELNKTGCPCHNYVVKSLQQLVDMSFHCMLHQNPYQTEEDWNVSTAGSKLLLSVAETARNPILQPVMNFVYAKCYSQDWHEREAALMAFGCIMGAPDDDGFADTVAQGLSVYLDGMSDAHPLVADTAGWVTATVCEMYPNIFKRRQEWCDQLMQKVGPLINGSDSGMSIRACSIVHNLALAFGDEDDEGGMPTNCFSPYYKSLVDVLLERIDRPADPSGSGKEQKLAIEALNALIDAAANDVSQVVTELVPALIARVDYFVGEYGMSRDDNTLTIEGLLCGSLSAVCKKMGRAIAPHVEKIMNSMNAVFAQQTETSLEEGIMLLGSLSNAVGPDFARYAGMIIDLVLKCASNFEEEDLCDAAVGVIGDLAGSLGKEGFYPILDKVVNTVFGALMSPEVDRDQKLSYFGCAGDMALHLGESYSQYVPSLMNIAQTAFQKSCSLNIKDDDDTLDYVMELWESLCQLCGLILQGQRDVQGAVANYAPNMLTLADHVSRNSVAHSEETFAAALGLIGDVANVCIDKPGAAQVVGPLLMNNSITQCIMRGSQVQKEQVQKQALWASKQIKGLIQKLFG